MTSLTSLCLHAYGQSVDPKRVAAALKNVDDNPDAALLKESLHVRLLGRAVLADASQALFRTELDEELEDTWTSALNALFGECMLVADGNLYSVSASHLALNNDGDIHDVSAFRMSTEMLDATQPLERVMPGRQASRRARGGKSHSLPWLHHC